MRAKILNASAGSGKTFQLAYKYVHDVVERPADYRHILAVTFTNKATEEMKTRILEKIHLLASGEPCDFLELLRRDLGLGEPEIRRRAAEARARILHDYSRFTVLTIDTFFQRILRAFIKELGLDLNYNIEIETESVLSKSADALIEQITVNRGLQRWLTEFVEERVDQGRKWDLREGILSLGGELFKERNKEALASARTREELARIVRRATAHAEAALAELHTTAAEAVRIITDAGLTASDYSGRSRSFALWFFTSVSGDPEPYTATAAKLSATTEGWCAKNSPAAATVPALQPLLRRMCDLYDGNIRQWNTCKLLRENYRSFALLADLYAEVQRMCDEQNTMLLCETKNILSEFIGRNDAPFIYEKVGNRFERFMIDEFQDTSVKEWENFLPLLQNAMAQSADNTVLLVGDIKQSIYRWRGGDWKILHSGAREALGREHTEVVDLQDNYRSLPAVVEFNNRVIERLVAADNRALNLKLDEAAERGALPAATREELHDTLADAYRGHAQRPRRRGPHPGYVSVETFDERPPVVERICELLDRGFRPADIMILVRGANDGAKIAAELLAFRQRNREERYRFDVTTQEALVIGAAPVSGFIAAALRLALDTDDSLNRAVYNRFLGRPFDRMPDDGERAFFRSLRLLPPEEAFERIVIRHDLQLSTQHTAYLQAIHEQIIAFSANRIADIPLFLRWWDEQGSKRSLSIERSASTVEIITVHKAKGLEKRAVLIPYCSWQLEPKSSGTIRNIVWAEALGGDAAEAGCVPVRYRKEMAQSEFSAEYYRELVYSHVDNVNLLYVALTRAAESLHVFVPQRGRHVGTLLMQSLAEDLPGCRRTENGDRLRCEFGEFTGPVPGDKQPAKVEHAVLAHYLTARADPKLRLPSQRYFEEESAEPSPRNLGILMHRAFQEAETEADIRAAVERMRTDGVLSDGERATLHRMLDRALADPTVRSWFGGGWERVRNEHGIVVPGSASTRRPDRVMVRGDRAVVVDYKFGSRDDGRYRRQLTEYMTLLQQMGYSRTEGYLWYVRQGKVERVSF